MRLFRHDLKSIAGPMDFAPFASMVLLLLLLLMLHSYLAPPLGVRIQLPVADQAVLPGLNNPWLVVSVDSAGQFYFDHQLIREDELRARLAAKVRAAKEPLTLLVQADESVRQARIVRLAGLAREAGLREVLIATRPPLFTPRQAPGRQP